MPGPWTQTRRTNGFIEALNGLFQAAKRKARGYTRFVRHLLTADMLHCIMREMSGYHRETRRPYRASE